MAPGSRGGAGDRGGDPAGGDDLGPVDPIEALDALLAELEGATVRIDGADVLDEAAVVELELLADKLEAAAATLVTMDAGLALASVSVAG